MAPEVQPRSTPTAMAEESPSECEEISKDLLRSPLKDGPFWVKLAVLGSFGGVAWLARRAAGSSVAARPQGQLLARAALFGLVVPSMSMASLLGVLYASCSRSKALSQKCASMLIPVCCGCVIDWKFRRAREELLRGIRGTVLDVGCGSGPYLQYYVRSRLGGGGVAKAVMLEPNPYMHPALKRSVEEAQAQDPGLEVEVRGGHLDAIPGTDVFDSVVFGNVLCEVPDQSAFLKDIGRLLKPGGRVYFSEHVAVKPKSSLMRRMQEAVNPYWRVITDGCNINRDTVDAIRAQPWVEDLRHWGFDMEAPICRMELGIATKKAA